VRGPEPQDCSADRPCDSGHLGLATIAAAVSALDQIFVALAALLPIVNPVGTAPIFLAMSADLPPPARRHLALVVGRNALLMLAAASLVGSYVLAFFGISLAVVRVAGGLVVLAAGWNLLHAGDAPSRPAAPLTDAWEREIGRRGFYPLTFPLTVGPGSISVAIAISAREVFTVRLLAADLVAVALVSASVWLSYRSASRLVNVLGETGTNVLLRLSAFILLCVAISILWSGIVGLIATLPRR
jgi:multiple antibiotic resistance protein